MANEQERKAGEARPICSVTLLPCRGKCATAEGCGGRLDDVPEEAVRWTRAALLHVEGVRVDIDEAITECRSQRGYPGPELREALRIAGELRAQLEQCIK